MTDPDPIPRGPLLFPPGTSAGTRRRRIAFVAVYAVLGACVVWPVYPLVASAFPLVLGLPLSFAWVVAVLAAGFGALVGLYVGDAREEARGNDAARRSTPSR
jgi:hypothetical protein